MLIPETPFPQVGSYALLVDCDAPPPQPAELVRILERRVTATLVSFPLRDGAGGNKVVPHAALIDASPLTGAEQREFHDLDRALAGKVGRDGRPTKRLTPREKAAKARRDELRLRMINGPILDRQLRFARGLQQRRAA